VKLLPEHRTHIKSNIDEVLAKYPSIAAEYEAGRFNKADKVKDLQKRFCFDLLYGTGLSSWLCHNVYSYANDTHIYSFLKTICPKVTKQY
jgi:hypothetical protein